MPWGVSEGGTPQPYRIVAEAAHWEKVRNKDGEYVLSKGENLMSLVLEGSAYRLVEDGDDWAVGEAIEPVDGKHNRRSFLIGKTDQWIDPREDGKRIESVRGPGEMPWAKSDLGRLINSLVELLGADTLADWGDWEDAATWAGKTYDLVPTHDTDADGNPVTYKTRSGDERIDYYFEAVNVETGGKSSGGKRGGGRKRAKSNGSDDLQGQLVAAYKDFDGSEDDFVEFVQSDDFEGHEALAKLSDDEFDKAIDAAIG